MTKIFRVAYNSAVNTIKERLDTIDETDIEKTIDAILNGATIFVYGAGRSGVIGKAFAMRLVQIGQRAYFIGESVTPIVTENDVTIILSNKGESFTSIQVGNIVRRVGSRLVVITANPNSKLTHIATIKIVLPSLPYDVNLAPLGTIFEESALILLDSIIAELMNKLKENEESMRKRHAIMV
ncbi:MAG: SIS domain-containing protein [Candidatus Thermoplasmatota archaeon]|jgi:6-phospho-3-hexuloisomerase|nr:SIS domain-containing protein [Candidatus Thermoplasmatota archaeon]MCL5963834.1 SIS domain-containing protein [Candidatus Thermoplasmatota archaeon]